MNSNKKEYRSAAVVQDDSMHQCIGSEDGLELRSEDDGRSYVRGYITTKEAYRIDGEGFDEEAFTDQAMQSIADQINDANRELSQGDVVFPDVDTVQQTTGNIEHQNQVKRAEALPHLADTRAVPAIEFEEAEFDGYGVEVKAPIREDALPKDTVEAIKQNIKDGVLSAFSIEFKNTVDEIQMVDGSLRRSIIDTDFAGGALTQMPINPTATLTAAEMRSVMKNNEYESMDEFKKQVKTEIRAEMRAEYKHDIGDWVSRDWSGANVYGKVRDRTKDQFTVEGNTITGESEDTPVYKMEEYDTDADEFTGQMIAVPQGGIKAWNNAPEERAVSGVEMSPPEKAVNAAQAALDAKEEYSDQVGDCGTGVGEAMAEAIVNDNLTQDMFTGGQNTAIPDYLDSHEDDLSTDKPPTDWGEAEWTDGCGNLQYALWGYYKDWFQDKEEEIAEAMENRAEQMENNAEIDVDMIPMADDAQLLYPSEGQAKAAANNLGMGETSHEHEFEGETWYMPGEDHDTFVETMNELKREIGMKSAYKEEEMRAEAAGVEFSGTMEGDLDESEIPNEGFEPHYLFPADTKSDSSYPVVDADGNLRRGNVEAAHGLGARGDVTDEELEEKLMALNEQFDDPPIEFKKGGNENRSSMGEDNQQGDSEGSLEDELEELRSTVEDVKQENEELRSQKEELEDELEDLNKSEELRSEIDELTEELRSQAETEGPVGDPDEEKNNEENRSGPKELVAAQSDYIQENRSVLAEKYDMTEEEVIEYAEK